MGLRVAAGAMACRGGDSGAGLAAGADPPESSPPLGAAFVLRVSPGSLTSFRSVKLEAGECRAVHMFVSLRYMGGALNKMELRDGLILEQNSCKNKAKRKSWGSYEAVLLLLLRVPSQRLGTQR